MGGYKFLFESISTVNLAARMQCDCQLLPKQETSSFLQLRVPTPPH